MAKPCWFGSDGTLLMSLIRTFAPFRTTSVDGTQIFDPSYSTLTTVKLMSSARAGSACAARTRPSAAAKPITNRRMSPSSSRNGPGVPEPHRTAPRNALSEPAPLVSSRSMRRDGTFRLRADFVPQGDQPQAIAALAAGLRAGERHQVLLGVTGSGKTFTVSQVVAQVNMPTLVIAPNKTLAAQLFHEFRSFFPDNAVRYFVSYYD